MKVITKIDGIDLLQMIANDDLECGTMIRHKREDLTRISNTTGEFKVDSVYEYYKYTAGDKRFHRCDENGKLGTKGQQRFINYSTLNKVFEIVEIEEEFNPLTDWIDESLFEEDKDIEDLGEIKLYEIYQEYLEKNFTVPMSNIISDIEALFEETNKKINELIKEVNKLKNK